MEIRYSGTIDEDEIERQVREARQAQNQSCSAFYDAVYAIALKLKRSEKETEKMTLRAFKAGLRQPGLRSHLVRAKPKDISAAFKAISEWEAMARAAAPFEASRVDTIAMPECNVINSV